MYSGAIPSVHSMKNGIKGNTGWCVCACVHMHACVRVWVHVYAFVCILFTCLCMHACVHVCLVCLGSQSIFEHLCTLTLLHGPLLLCSSALQGSSKCVTFLLKDIIGNLAAFVASVPLHCHIPEYTKQPGHLAKPLWLSLTSMTYILWADVKMEYCCNVLWRDKQYLQHRPAMATHLNGRERNKAHQAGTQLGQCADISAGWV